MDVRDFHKDFLEEIKATAATEGAGSNAAFVYASSITASSDFTFEVLVLSRIPNLDNVLISLSVILPSLIL